MRWLVAVVLLGLASGAAGDPLAITVGDSIVQSIPPGTTWPGRGWAGDLPKYVSAGLAWQDFAFGGQSTKTFLETGRWAGALAVNPAFVLIEFGHNDGNPDPTYYTDPATTFRENLHRMIVEARAIGAEPVLVTPAGIRYSLDGVHVFRPDTVTPWADAMAAQALADGVGLVDLHEATLDLYDALGIATAQATLGFEYPAGHVDEAHFSAFGADEVARLIVAAIPAASPALAAHLSPVAVPVPALLPPATTLLAAGLWGVCAACAARARAGPSRAATRRSRVRAS